MRLGDTILHNLKQDKGFTELPRTVTDKEYEELLNSGYEQLWRGAPKQFNNSFKNDKETHTGVGVFGNGIYTAYGNTGLDTAKEYASFQKDGEIMRSALSKDAEVISQTEMRQIRGEVESKLSTAMQDNLMNQIRGIGDKKTLEQEYADILVLKKVLNDEGKIAVSLGYDAMRIPGDEYMVIYNRGVLGVAK